jgi:putative SOS response-associated peptidase YedK
VTGALHIRKPAWKHSCIDEIPTILIPVFAWHFATRSPLHKSILSLKIISMCGRYALKHGPAQLEEWYETNVMPHFNPHYNIAPGTTTVVVSNAGDDRIASMMRWGFIPAWAKDPSAMPMLNNARAETIAEKTMFRRALRQRRCLIPASGFYEWKAVPGQKSKQPFYISFKDHTPMSLAGLWETAKNADGTVLDTFAVITTQANEVLEPIHHRMPVILERSDWSQWLSAEPVSDEALLSMLRPLDTSNMQAWGVAHAVNKVFNNSPALLLPIACIR